MGNLCKIYTKLPVEECIKLVGDHPAVKRYGDNPITVVEKGNYFEGLTVIKLINSINDVYEALDKNAEAWQDLDAYGDRLYGSFK